MLPRMETCPNCTAPREAGLVACKFCNTPFVRDVATEAVRCPQCSAYSDIRATNCVKCKAWVVVKCMFCGGLTPHHFPNCQHCNEQFQGAAERYQARVDAANSQQRMEVLSAVGGVAAAFLGAAAGAALSDSGPSVGHKHHHGRRRRHDDDSGSSGGSWTDVFSGDDNNNAGGSGGNLMDSDLTGGGDDNNNG